MFRRVIFWVHLSAGVLTGLVVCTMSFTGVLLTYERQLKRWVAESHYLSVEQQGDRLPIEQLLIEQQLASPDLVPTAAIVTNDSGAPVALRAGRQGGVELNPYDGTLMRTEAPALNEFFSVVTRFHRWFNLEGESRTTARQVTGVSNVIFMFLVLSGMYLWLPAIWQKAMFKVRLWLRSDYANAKVRDFHWHHVFGIWMAIPLIAVVYTGMVISYPWAANFMYRVFGAEVPVQQQGGSGPQPGIAPQTARLASEGDSGRTDRRDRIDAAEMADSVAAVATTQWKSLDELIAVALADPASADWQRFTLTLPQSDAKQVQIEIDHGNGAQVQLRHTLSLDRATGAIVGRRGFADQPAAQRLRSIARFLHTGEVMGFWGQTIAGLASLAAVLLVWTGLALAWRRLIQPLYNR